MLKITIPGTEYWDEKNERFFYTKETHLQLEHSLVSISKWEAKWHKPFMDNKELTGEQIVDYIRCMTLTQNVDPNVYYSIDNKTIKQIREYIDDPMTATWFSKTVGPPPKKEIITSEIIYYWMIKLNIPVEFQKWHINRLITLIKVFEAKDDTKSGKKINKHQIAQNYAAINAARRKALHTKG